MTSSPFERQLTEPESTERRTAAPAARMSDGPQQYPPGPSFLEHDRPSVRLVELPAWLQAFAASTGEPNIERADEVDFDVTPEAVMSDDEKPAPQPNPDSESLAPAAPQSTSDFGTSFISEDDLPEWLRSIAPDEDDDSGADVLLLGQSEASGQVAVPNVTRAWTTSGDARGVDESSSIFALVASQPTHGPLPVGEAAGPAREPGRRTSARPQESAESVGEHPGGAPQAISPASAMPDASPIDGVQAPTRGRLPLLPILVAALLLVALAVVALQLFAS